MSSNNMMDRSFLTVNIANLVKELTFKEKVRLLSGRDWWNTVPIPRLHIPSVKVTDGPNGARGDSFFNMTPGIAIPNATALGATFDHDLARQAGELLAEEAKARRAVCLLAPTINIQRSPLGGRAFESFSEDPTHSGHIAADFINGLQSRGVSSTIKHFIANDQEHERMGVDSIVAARPFREIYLRSFQIAHKLSRPSAYMTSYNKLNGVHCSENEWLLKDILREEFGHDGLIMSDWYGTYSVSRAINAGMNIEMPGPGRWRTEELITHLVDAHKIDIRQINRLVFELLTWIQKFARKNESLVYSEPAPEKTRHETQLEDSKIVREIGAESQVLLKNNDVLPLKQGRIAVIGPNAKAKVITGGGSALLNASWVVTPWEGLKANAPQGIELEYALGAFTAKFLPVFDDCFKAKDGSVGFDIAHYAIVGGKKSEHASVRGTRINSDMFMGDFKHPDLGKDWITEIETTFTSPVDGQYQFGFVVTGMGWLWVDGELLIDNSSNQTQGTCFMSDGTIEVKADLTVRCGQTYSLRALHDSRKPHDGSRTETTPFDIVGMRLGAFPVSRPEYDLEAAVTLAKGADAAILVVGLNADWESEGYDRPTLSMPPGTDALIEKVAAVNSKTIVVIQAGSAVSMPWLDKVAAVVQSWYGGNEAGNAIADVLYGKVNPSGRLPISLPRRKEDIAANLNFKSSRTKVHYEEGIWVGYKHHNARGIAPLFPFGHGLSYTTFEYSDLRVTTSSVKCADEWQAEATVTVKNTGTVSGNHSVHFYLCPPKETATSLKHPSHTLQAFAKIKKLEPGASETISVILDKYAISHWDDVWKVWRAELGDWSVKIGVDSQNLFGDAKFTIDEELQWKGL